MTGPTRLKASQVAAVRASLAEKQGGRCAICKGKFTAKHPRDPVLDHNHTTGAIRGVPCRACNSLLGPIENNAARFGVLDIAAFASGVPAYLRTHAVNVTGLLHPTHKSPEEKREARNKKARVARAKKRADPPPLI